MTRQERWRARNPWMKSLFNARKRCNNPKHDKYSSYGGRGVRCLISGEEVRKLWERDGAAKMTKPSLDRIDEDGHYTFENCRFIEYALNRSMRRNPNTCPQVACAAEDPGTLN